MKPRILSERTCYPRWKVTVFLRKPWFFHKSHRKYPKRGNGELGNAVPNLRKTAFPTYRAKLSEKKRRGTLGTSKEYQSFNSHNRNRSPSISPNSIISQPTLKPHYPHDRTVLEPTERTCRDRWRQLRWCCAVLTHWLGGAGTPWVSVFNSDGLQMVPTGGIVS